MMVNIHQRGWSLMEVMVVVSIMTILVVVGYPAIMNLLYRWEAKEVRMLIIQSLKETQMYSQFHHQNVVMCFADEQGICHRMATHQIMIFRDVDNNQRVDKEGELLQKYPLSLKYGRVQMNVSLQRHYMKYFWDSGTPKGHFGHIKYCSSKGRDDLAYRVIVSAMGYVRYEGEKGC